MGGRLSSGKEQSRRAFMNDVHFLCSVRWPPTSPCKRKAKLSAISAPERSAALIYFYWSVFFKIYFANAGDPRHGHFAVEVVLHGILAEEQVHLVIVAIRAVQALGHNVHVDKVWL